MRHYYNVFEIDGEKFKVDIAGALTAMDFNKKHPKHKIDIKEFYFSDELNNNPFNSIKINTEETKE